MNHSALDKFTAAIVEAVAHGMTTNPGAYAPGLTAESVGASMRAALLQGGAGAIAITTSIKVACKVYGIKPTIKGINEWIGYASRLSPKKLSAAIDAAFRTHCCNVQFNMMDLPKLDRDIREAYAANPSQETIDAATIAAREKYAIKSDTSAPRAAGFLAVGGAL